MPYKDPEKRKEFWKRWYAKNKEKHRKDAREYNKKTNKRNKNYVDEYKIKRGCLICGEFESVCLDCHHKFPKDKVMEISNLVRQGYSLKTIKKELDKCVIICSNCHRKLHKGIITI